MTFGQCPASAEAAKRAIGAFPIAAKAPNWLQNVYFLASHQDRQRRSDRALRQVVLLGDNGHRAGWGSVPVPYLMEAQLALPEASLTPLD